jgi:hypothetical protein
MCSILPSRFQERGLDLCQSVECLLSSNQRAWGCNGTRSSSLDRFIAGDRGSFLQVGKWYWSCG